MSELYRQYYKRAIDAHKAGLKLVLGGTGLGKTSSFARLLTQEQHPAGTKFVYVANRRQLLDEMQSQFKPGQLPIFYQKQDKDQLRAVLTDGTLADFWHLPATKNLINEWNRVGMIPIHHGGIGQRITQYGRLTQQNWLADEGVIDLEEKTREIFAPLKNLFTFAKQLATQKPLPNQAITPKEATDLASLPFWRTLFPYVAFQEEAGTCLFLVTLHKAFRGFYDGRRLIHLGNWSAPERERYIFVFDEFDFLESDLLGLLSEDLGMSDPFGLVETFYERMSMPKMSYKDYLAREPRWQPVREEIDKILARIKSLDEQGIPFPAINHFVTADDELRHRAIFQSNFSLFNAPVYLRIGERRKYSFDLCTEPTNQGAFRLLNTVTRAANDIFRLFAWLEETHEDIYPELLRQCFARTVYEGEVRRIKQLGRRYELCETNYGDLLTNGFGFFEIEADRSQLTDPEEVTLQYLSISSSPEAIIRKLCRNHLVFGLSATAHLRRVLRNFDWEGMRHPLRPAESFQPLPLSTDDITCIQTATSEKAAARNNAIRWELAQPLDSSSALGRQLKAIIQRNPTAFSKQGAKREQRTKRVQHFFGTLAWIAGQPATASPPTHLLFFSSLKHIQFLLDTARENEDNWFSATPIGQSKHNAAFRLVDVHYRDERTGKELDCHVVFYDADLGQTLRLDNELARQYNSLFWDNKPVLVITTYPSAGNGVNLQYFVQEDDWQANRPEARRDFTHIHLLDSPYFYFGGTHHTDAAGNPLSLAEERAVIKRDVYGIMKLLNAKCISEPQARAQLNSIRTINTFNNTYLTSSDGVINQVSVFVQALGRIERVWQPTADQVIRLDAGVYNALARFAGEEEFADDYEQFLSLASGNIVRLLTAIQSQLPTQRRNVTNQVLDIRRANEQVRERIHGLVRELSQYRQNRQPSDARRRWEQLREDVLRHDFQSRLLTEIGGVFRTNYANEGRLLISQRLKIAPWQTASPEFSPWSLNAIYEPIHALEYPALMNHFRIRGYEMAFLDQGQYFLPYVYQAILTGAIGEELIRALLTLNKIATSADEIPDELFEVADLKIVNRPILIDCKNYGPQTLRHFALPADDPLYHPKLNEERFKTKMVAKWHTINAHYKATAEEPCRLIIMNVRHDTTGALRFYDCQFKPVKTWGEASIIVLTGALSTNLLTESFNRLTTLLK
ncbi:hypothetical protein GCM10023187_10360 [Nibrella viscosa]|uniref:Uncharacterized protein n=1 Tax=Nibrella viscosa TaxID=1084524 RepID=A0ABP8K187_9BACT